ncbi:MAG: RNA polymerase sigma-70 factor (ECF subfamily) [Myxococcota bacterium]|jgi:RNA polymerase sigma-70 factor (ECF subfamily)
MHFPWRKSPKERRFHDKLLPHADNLFAYGLRLTHNRSDAEDLVQESLLKAFDALERLPDNSNYKGWLFTILRNTWLSRMRRAGRVEYSDSPPDRADKRPDPLQTIEHGRSQRPGDCFDDTVHCALMSLPEAQRSAVLLCDVERMPYADIAKIMGCPIGTVRSRIFHARRALRSALHNYAQEQGVGRNGDVALSKG